MKYVQTLRSQLRFRNRNIVNMLNRSPIIQITCYLQKRCRIKKQSAKPIVLSERTMFSLVNRTIPSSQQTDDVLRSTTAKPHRRKLSSDLCFYSRFQLILSSNPHYHNLNSIRFDRNIRDGNIMGMIFVRRILKIQIRFMNMYFLWTINFDKVWQ